MRAKTRADAKRLRRTAEDVGVQARGAARSAAGDVRTAGARARGAVDEQRPSTRAGETRRRGGPPLLVRLALMTLVVAAVVWTVRALRTRPRGEEQAGDAGPGGDAPTAGTATTNGASEGSTADTHTAR